jgi:hypothetical protein
MELPDNKEPKDNNPKITGNKKPGSQAFAPDSKLRPPNSQLSFGFEDDGKQGKRSGRKTLHSKLRTPNSQLPLEFYQEVLDEEHSADFAVARGDDSLEDEIALLRVKIKIIWEKEPGEHKLFLEALDILAKLVKAKYSTHKKEDKGLGEAIQNIIRDIGVPLGVAALNKKL